MPDSVDFFESESGQGETQGFVDYLVDKYRQDLEAFNKAAAEAGAEAVRYEIPEELEKLSRFREFAKKFCKEVKPSQISTEAAGDFVIQLTNGERFWIVGGVPVGLMQESNYVPVGGF